MDASASVNCVEVVVKVITKLAMITSEMRTTYMSAFRLRAASKGIELQTQMKMRIASAGKSTRP